ncbi:MAG: lycopene cyclase domain-containing protein [Bacteroidia bacterium]|jgi:lycopene cyclase domain-containing protein
MSFYAIVLFWAVLVPVVFSFNRRIGYYRKFKSLAAGISITALLLIATDALFVQSGVWGFNADYVWPLRFLHLPLEEWLFFVAIPYASIFIYESLRILLPPITYGKWMQRLTWALAILCMLTALTNPFRLYTFWASSIAAVLLVWHALFKKAWMGNFWLAFGVHLIPFLVVNGLLTGMATEHPVVWYNPEENLGLRIFTIPVEDLVYALIMLLVPVSIIESIEAKKNTFKESMLFV